MNTRYQSYHPFVICLAAAGLFLAACGPTSSGDEAAASEPEEAALSKSADVAMKAIADALSEGEGGILWKAMPTSYQEDVTEIVQLAGQKIDAEIYDKVFAVVDRTITVADKQKEFMFNSNLGAKPPEEQVAKFREAWPSIVNLVKTLTESPIASASGLQGFEGESFFSGTVSQVIKDVETLSALNPEEDQMQISKLSEATFELLESSEAGALLQIKLPDGSTEQETFVQVDERWVPGEMAADWPQEMANARAQLESIDPQQIAQQKPQIMSVFAMIDGVLGQIEAAETQEQFDQALQGAMMPMMGLMMMGQGLGGGMSPDPQAPQAPDMPQTPPTQ